MTSRVGREQSATNFRSVEAMKSFDNKMSGKEGG